MDSIAKKTYPANRTRTITINTASLDADPGVLDKFGEAFRVVPDLPGHLLGRVAYRFGAMSSIFLRKSGEWMIFTSSVFRRTTSALGVAAGASRPNQVPRLKPLSRPRPAWARLAARVSAGSWSRPVRAVCRP